MRSTLSFSILLSWAPAEIFVWGGSSPKNVPHKDNKGPPHDEKGPHVGDKDKIVLKRPPYTDWFFYSPPPCGRQCLLLINSFSYIILNSN